MSWLNYLDSSYFFLLLSLSSFLGSDCRDLNLGYVRPCITWQADSSCLLVSGTATAQVHMGWCRVIRLLSVPSGYFRPTGGRLYDMIMSTRQEIVWIPGRLADFTPNLA